MAKFTIEFGDDYGRNQSLNTLRITKIRGRFSISDWHARPEGSYAVGDSMSAMPTLPGMYLDVDPADRNIRFHDPLKKDPATVRRANTVIGGTTLGLDADFTPEEDRSQTLSADQMKTLLCELKRKLESRSIRMISGKLPTDAELKKLPGRELHDVWNSSTRKAKYKDQQDEYADKLDSPVS